MDPKNTGPKKDEIDYSDPQKIKDLQQKIADIKKESSNVVQQSSSFFSNSNKNKVTLDPRLKELQEQLIKEVTKPRRPKNDGKYNAADPPTVDGEHYKGNNDITSNTIQAHNLAAFGCGCCMAMIFALTGTGGP